MLNNMKKFCTNFVRNTCLLGSGFSAVENHAVNTIVILGPLN